MDLEKHLDRLNHWEARRMAAITRDRVTVDSAGVAVVTYTPEDELDRLIRLHNRAMKLMLLWQSRYPNMWGWQEDQPSFTYAYDYARVVIDQRLGLRKTLSFGGYRGETLDNQLRAAIRAQVDSIIAALQDIEEMAS